MWDKLKALFNRKTPLLGIDIGTGAVKMAEVGWKNDRPALNSYGISELSDAAGDDGEELAKALRKLLANSRTSCKDAVVAVGGRTLFARQIKFPAMPLAELMEAVKWEVEKHVPYPAGTYTYDFAVAEQDDQKSEQKVMLFASPNEVINEMTKLLKSAGLRTIAVDIEPLAFYRTCVGAENAMLVDIGMAKSQITIFQQGCPIVIRTVPIGGNRFTDIFMRTYGLEFQQAERLKCRYNPPSEANQITAGELEQELALLLRDFGDDIRRTREYFIAQNKQAIIDKVYLTGGGTKFPNLSSYLASQLDIPVMVNNPLPFIDIPPNIDKSTLRDVAPRLNTAIGLAMRGGEQHD